MWWKEEKPIQVRRGKRNRKRRTVREPLLFVKSRRADKAENWHHRLGSIVLLTTILVGVLWLTMMGAQSLGRVLFSENAQFEIRELVFACDPGGRLKASHIREYAGLEEGQNLFAVNIDRVRRNLESVPLVANVEVSRQLPDTLVVRVRERTALAQLGQGGRNFRLSVDAEGYVLGPSAHSAALPVITGVREGGLRPGTLLSSQGVRDALEVLEVCDTTRLSQYVKISSIDIRHPEYLDLRLKVGTRVLLARKDLDWRLRQIAAILQTDDQGGQSIATIDGTGDDVFPVQYR